MVRAQLIGVLPAMSHWSRVALPRLVYLVTLGDLLAMLVGRADATLNDLALFASSLGALSGVVSDGALKVVCGRRPRCICCWVP